MMHMSEFEVSSSPGTCISKIQIWPKLAVNPILNLLASVFCTLLGFFFGVM